MNEDETRAELIDPKLKACGWGVVEGSKVFRNHPITAGKIQNGGVPIPEPSPMVRTSVSLVME